MDSKNIFHIPRPCTAGRSRAWYFWTWFPWPTLTLTLSSGPLFVSLHYIFYTPSRRRYSSQTRRLQKLRRRRIWWVGRYLTTMSQKQLESECLEAFEQGNKRDAERLLPQIRQPSKVMIRVIIWSWSTVTVKVNGIAIDIHRQSSLLQPMAGWSRNWLNNKVQVRRQLWKLGNALHYTTPLPPVTWRW